MECNRDIIRDPEQMEVVLWEVWFEGTDFIAAAYHSLGQPLRLTLPGKRSSRHMQQIEVRMQLIGKW